MWSTGCYAELDSTSPLRLKRERVMLKRVRVNIVDIRMYVCVFSPPSVKKPVEDWL